MAVYKTIGLMSGTSLDGLDMVYAEFENLSDEWSFRILKSESLNYDSLWKARFAGIAQKQAVDFVQCHVDYGHYLGAQTKAFIRNNQLEVDVVGVHGHTVFHQPAMGFTSQIGDGSAIAALSEQLVACDFRSMDVARGGQGAPLVPIGDALLFSEYVARLNLGGFSNISFGGIDDLWAYDICPVNIIMNEICRKQGLEYDDKGNIARGGQVDRALLHQLNQLEYYQQQAPKSLGKEWLDEQIWPLLKTPYSDEDILRTLVEHMSDQIAASLGSSQLKPGKVLVTGGGAYNDFLMERIRVKTNFEIIIPEPQIVDMKEALIFAFLGLLRLLDQKNVLAKVTGARTASISGALYQGKLL